MALEPNADLPKIQFALPGGYSDHTGLSMLPSFSILVPHPTHAQQLRLARAIADVSCVVRQSKAGLIPWKCFLSEPKDARVSIEEATFKDVTFSRSSSLKEVDGKTVNVVEANFEINADFVQLGPVIPEPEWVMQIYANAWELEQNGQKPNLGVLQFGFRLKEGGSDLETRLSRLNATPAKVKFLITIPTKEDASLIKTALANNAAYRWERCTLYSNQ